jgi:2-oxoglutarate ferredoxin oxidoreductase subunit gamma
VLIAMSQEAFDKNFKDLKEEGVLMVDTTYIKEIPEIRVKVFKISATENAEKTFGTKVYANMLMLGALVKTTAIVSEKSMKKAIENTVARNVFEINFKAYEKGKELIR